MLPEFAPINYYDLSNGMRVGLCRVPYTNSINIGFGIPYGSAVEPHDRKGLAHLLEHMLFRGTANFSDEEIKIGLAETGGYANAATSQENILVLVRILASNLESTMAVLADILQNATFPEDLLKIERNVVINELKMEVNDEEYRALSKIMHHVWDDSILADSPAGKITDIKATTRQNLLKYYENFFRPETFSVSIVGRFDEQEVLELLEHHFSSWTRPSFKKPTNIKKPKIGKGKKYKIEKPDNLVSTVLRVFPTRGREQQLINTIPYVFLQLLLGRPLTGRLWQRVRNLEGLAYSIHMNPLQYEQAGILILEYETQDRLVEKAQKVIDDTLQEVSEKLVTDKEMDALRSQFDSDIIMLAENEFSLMQFILTQLLFYKQNFSLEDWTQVAHAITTKDLRELALETFDPKKETSAIISAAK